MRPQILIETSPIKIIEMEEMAGDKSFLMRVKAISGRADEKNGNGRIYPSAVLEREAQRIKKEITDNPGVNLEQADHPQGSPSIPGTASLLEDISFNPQTKEVITTSKIFKTGVGEDLAAILRGGGKVGRSSRGFGTLKAGEVNGVKGDVVQEDYKAVAFDFVIGQSTPGAFVTQFLEQARQLGLAGEADMDLQNVKVSDLRTARPDLFADIEKELTAKVEQSFETKVKDAVSAKVADESKAIEMRLRAEFAEAAKKKKNGKADDEEDAADKGDDEETEQHIAALKAAGYKVEGKTVKKEVAVESAEMKAHKQEITATKNALTEAQKLVSELADKVKKIEDGNAAVTVSAYILEKVHNKPHRSSLANRLAELCKTREEVDARLPIEEQYIAALLNEKAGGRGFTGRNEEPGSEGAGDKKFKTTSGQEITEAQKRTRDLAGVPN